LPGKQPDLSKELYNVKPSTFLRVVNRRLPRCVRGGHLDEAGKTAPFTKMMNEEIFNKSHLPWSNDPLVVTLIIVLIGISIAMYFIIVHGWSW
jgi:hypothetical protein